MMVCVTSVPVLILQVSCDCLHVPSHLLGTVLCLFDCVVTGTVPRPAPQAGLGKCNTLSVIALSTSPNTIFQWFIEDGLILYSIDRLTEPL